MSARPHRYHRLLKGIGTGALLVLGLGLPQAAQGDAISIVLGASALTFPDADPDTVSAIPASQNPFTITAKAQAATTTWMMTVIATDDIRGGSNVIPASSLFWTATGARFQGGSMSKTSMVTVGSGPKGDFSGTLSFFLSNSWSYVPGSYSTQLVYTLVAP